ncbi:carbon-nitrogen hydrolase family protein [Anaeroselena agilis]|uniref:Carbon-nitrogen hydrolase family protein n=1 Tax=Anaeroselena agilis TaxID=3063788 RepID=A0ABU3NYZ7_9FIRM|nr:carbon-nitrogen hydrolase family protein [Selenomonadales bacterium 4137-cl]
MPSRFKAAAAQYPITAYRSWREYAEALEGWVAAGAQAGARLLVFPEYAAMELISLVPGHRNLTLADQLAAMQDFAAPYLDLHCSLARTYGVHILAGSFPVKRDGLFRNAAAFISPDGPPAIREKRIMTRFEREEWGISPGEDAPPVECELGRIGVAICYDSEFPLLVRRQAEAGAQVILAPSCTDTLAGYWRVRIACQARALENQCIVVQAPTVGRADWCPAVDENIGAAGFFAPPDSGFPDNGVLALGELNKPGWIYADIDPAAIAAVRTEGKVLNHKHWPEQF